MLTFIAIVTLVWMVGVFAVDSLEHIADEYDTKPSKPETIKPVVDYGYSGKGWY